MLCSTMAVRTEHCAFCLQISNTVMHESGIPIVHTWNETLPLWDYHRDNGAGLECTHFCFPSAPQLWVHALWQALSNARSQLMPLPMRKALPRQIRKI